MEDNKNMLDEFDRNELVKDLNEYCDKADCDNECPLRKEKLCRYPNWDLVSDETLTQCATTIAVNYKQDETEIVVEDHEEDDMDKVTNPQHYQTNEMECIDEMVVVFGKEAVINFCNLNAWKYRYRSDNKGGKEDLAKADWYLQKSLELQAESNPIQQINVKYGPKYEIYIDGRLKRVKG